MTIELHLPVFETLRIDACCRAAGLDFAAILARYANIITGARYTAPEPGTTEQGPTATEQGITPAPAPTIGRLTTPAPTPRVNLNRPGDIIEHATADAIDWTDPALYA